MWLGSRYGGMYEKSGSSIGDSFNGLFAPGLSKDLYRSPPSRSNGHTRSAHAHADPHPYLHRLTHHHQYPYGHFHAHGDRDGHLLVRLPPCAVTFTMGNTATTPLGYMWQDDICGVEGQAANYAKLTAIVVDEYSAAGSVMGAFYGCDTTNNVPTTLITQTGPMPAAYGWVTMAVTPPVVNPGTYCLVAISSSYSVMATSGNGYRIGGLYTYSGIAGTVSPNSLVAPANNAYNNSYLASSLMIQGLWTCP